ncbi:MAG: hypothetical protein ACRDQ4_25960, partial [Pseudonocardiaceae bacterium]
GPPLPAGGTLLARALRQRPVGGVMGVRTTRAGGAQAGRWAAGGSPPASAVSIDVHDLTSGGLSHARGYPINDRGHIKTRSHPGAKHRYSR